MCVCYLLLKTNVPFLCYIYIHQPFSTFVTRRVFIKSFTSDNRPVSMCLNKPAKHMYVELRNYFFEIYHYIPCILVLINES